MPPRRRCLPVFLPLLQRISCRRSLRIFPSAPWTLVCRIPWLPPFYLTAPIVNISHNVIYINPRSHYEGFELFTTLAHEGFPGHLYQTTTTSASGCAPIRSILNYPGYVEGWATYVEMLSYSYAGLPEEKASLLMHNQSALLTSMPPQIYPFMQRAGHSVTLRLLK